MLPLPLLAQTTMDINKAAYKVISLPGRPDFLTTDGVSAWVVDDNNGHIRKISLAGTKPPLTVDIPRACAAPVMAFHSVWVVSCAEKKIYRIDPATGKILARIATGTADPGGEMSLAAGDGSIWILSDSSGMLSRIDPAADTIQARIKVSSRSYCAGFGYGAVWITSSGGSVVQRIDPATNTVAATIPTGKHPRFISIGGGAVWTLNQGDGTVTRIDPARNSVTASIDVQAPGPGGDIAAGGGLVWIVSTNKGRPLQTIRMADNRVTTIYRETENNKKSIRVDGAARVAGGYMWVSGLYAGKVWVFKD